MNPSNYITMHDKLLLLSYPTINCIERFLSREKTCLRLKKQCRYKVIILVVPQDLSITQNVLHFHHML